MDIFDEVSEDLRQDQAVALAKRYGVWLIAACVAVLIAVGAQQGWQAWQHKRASQAAMQFIALTQMDPNATADAQVKAAQALNQFAATAPEGYKTLANLRAAALYAGAGKLAQAQALWLGVAQDGSADPLLRDAATLTWAQASIGSAPNADVQAKLQPLALQANPYHALAREALALLYLHEGNAAQAKVLLTQITADPASPDNVRGRAQALLASLNG